MGSGCPVGEGVDVEEFEDLSLQWSEDGFEGLDGSAVAAMSAGVANPW
jgi:hypothetical protein